MSTRQAGLTAMALGLVLGLAWLARSVGTSSSVEREPAAARAEAPPARSPESVRSEGERVAAAGEVEHAVAAAPEGPQLEVLALRAGTLEPVAGAELWCWSDPTSPAWLARDRAEAARSDGRLDSLLEASSGPCEADAAGRALLPAPVRGGLVVARSPGWFGSEWVEPGAPRPCVVELRADRELVVRVVDGAGRPVAGVAASLRELWAGYADDRLRARSGADGLARLRHAGAELARSVEPDAAYVLALAELLDPPVEAELDLDALQEEPVELVLPETGAVELVVLDAQGAPFTGSLDVSLHLVAQASDRAPRDDPYLEREGIVTGRARFGHVTPGRELIAAARRADGLGSAELRAAGPRAAGELATLTLQLGEEGPAVRGRALDEAGAPMANAELHAQLEVAGKRRWWGRVGTDAEGRFTWALRTGPEAERAFVLTRRLDSGEEVARARALLSTSEGSQDVGALVLRPSPLLASGRVIDDRGAPVAGASVSASVPDEVASTFASVRADPDGRFRLRGACASPTLALVARREGARGEDVELPRGSAGVVLRLPSVGALRGRVLLDPSLRLGRAWVEVLEQESGRRLRLARPVADGSFALRAVPAGLCRVRVVALGEELAVVEQVAVEPGSTASDPRLDPLDLRDGWRVLELDVVAEHGPPPGELRVHLQRGGEDDWERFGSGLALVLTDGSPVDVTLHAEGFLPHQVRGLVRDATVALRPAPRVVLELTGVATPRAPLRLEVQLAPIDPESDPAPRSERVELDPQGRAGCRPGFVGSARLRLTLVDGATWNRARLALPDDGRVELLDTELEQRFELAVSPAALADALARLGR